MVITIDGPTASGKSTIAKRLAAHLGFYCLSTGMLYRAVAYLMKKEFHIDIDNQSALAAADLSFINDLVYSYENGKPAIFFHNKNITQHLFNAEFDQGSSVVSSYGPIRTALLSIQQKTGERYNVIAEGRDCGSVIFPNAGYKFFITASIQIRAERKLKDYPHATLQKIIEELNERDNRDQKRLISPLVISQGALVIDTSFLSVEEVLDKMLSHLALAKEKGSILDIK